MSDVEEEEEKPKPKPKPKKGKKKAGVTIPEEWPWEEAKKFFEKPDVTPADEVEVIPNSLVLDPSLPSDT